MELPRGSYVPRFYRRDTHEGILTEVVPTQNGKQASPLLEISGTQDLELRKDADKLLGPAVLWLSFLLVIAILLCGWLIYQNRKLRERSAVIPGGNATAQLSTGKCLSTSGGKGWTNTPFPIQTGIFSASFDATPGASLRINDVIAFSDGAQTAINKFAVLVAFSETGYILARNGNSYTAANAIRFSPGEAYHFRLVIDAPGHLYSVYVTPPHSSETILGTNFAFRSEAAAVKSLNSIGSMVDSSSGTITYCNFIID